MKIVDYSIDMSGKSTYLESHAEKEALKFWIGNNRPDFSDTNSIINRLEDNKPDIVDISEGGRNMLRDAEKCEKDDDIELSLSSEDRLKIDLIERFLQGLTGKKIKIRVPEKLKLKDKQDNLVLQIKLDNPGQQSNIFGWGLEYDLTKKYYEKETMTFKSQGTVTTADGRKLEFALDLSMKREFMLEENLSIRAGDAKIDPLVINFDNSALDMTDDKIKFDLNSDGQEEEISFLAKGSGFLALDLNDDGIINDGKELFGPQTGNGFAELANYDSDGNKWIDENDLVFYRLKIWVKDEEGKDALFTLNDKGIGALYLGSIKTSFSIKDTGNNLAGQIQRTGVFLDENGKVGTLQHVDIAI